MSLNFRLTNVKDWETVCYKDDRMNVVTEGLIWATMSVGLGEIKANNIDEWLLRLSLSDKLFGTQLFTAKREQRPFTREELEQHIGLTTNATNETRLQFQKRVVNSFLEEKKRELKVA